MSDYLFRGLEIGDLWIERSHNGRELSLVIVVDDVFEATTYEMSLVSYQREQGLLTSTIGTNCDKSEVLFSFLVKSAIMAKSVIE